MLFRQLGHITSRHPSVVIGIWIVLLIVTIQRAPTWESVVENGEFAFLPRDSPSVIADELFRRTFPDHSVSSSVVLVLRREARREGLLDEDYEFIRQVVVPGLRQTIGFPEDQDEHEEGSEAAGQSLVRKLSWRETPHIGQLYDSPDGKASIVVLELKSEFLDQGNAALIADVERFLQERRHIPTNKTPSNDPTQMSIPQGLDIAFSGTATFGRDIIREANNSAESTETWTVILVIFLLLIMYRAPLLAVIPLLTVAVAGAISISLLSIAAELGWVRLFNGIEAYVTVLVYGAGVDYCLFLIARYREELEAGANIEDAICVALTKVGSALAASAGTTMCGIGMMWFAEFGKFQQAGIAIAFGLLMTLCAALTLTPAILRLSGRWAFWPSVPAQRPATGAGWVARPDKFSRLLAVGWKRIGRLHLRRPWMMWLSSILGMLPFSILGIVFFGHLSYGLISELPDTAPCVQGAAALQAHFPAGEVAPVRALVDLPSRNFAKLERKPGPPQDVVDFTENILAHGDELGIQAIRSLADPTGGRDIGGGLPSQVIRMRAVKDFATEKYPSITRLDLISTRDPFTRSSIQEFHNVREEIPKLLPESMAGATIHLAGETANLSDLKEVTDRDQVRVNGLVTLVVFVILWILLKKPGLCSYLMFTVLFSYLATLGCTFIFFWALDPSGFSGLDWKVPMFLFTILIAVGEDYNIFLLTRIEEEKLVHGPVEGITVALDRTGSIISSCGIIMAGTFSSLMAGSLVGMDQLGFALALGVLFDTFLIRPIMVPSFLILLAQGKLGIFSRLAGYATEESGADSGGTAESAI